MMKTVRMTLDEIKNLMRSYLGYFEDCICTGAAFNPEAWKQYNLCFDHCLRAGCVTEEDRYQDPILPPTAEDARFIGRLISQHCC